MTAASIAKKFGIRVYTIGLGRETGEDIGAIDYKTLQDIACFKHMENSIEHKVRQSYLKFIKILINLKKLR